MLPRLFAFVFISLLVRWPLLPDSEKHSENAPTSVPIDRWLSEGERKTFGWKVHVSQPALTFQQRDQVWVTASLDSKSLQKASAQHDLHFWLKVADESGKWFEGQTYNHYEINKQFEQAVDVEFEAGLYLKPGRFTVAVVLYDATLNEHNVAFSHVTVPRLKGESFDGLLDGLPEVEFLPIPVDGIATPGSGHLHLPVPSKLPIELDILVDLGNPAGLGEPSNAHRRSDTLIPGRGGPISPTWPQMPETRWRGSTRPTVKAYETEILEAANVLSDLNLQSGCSRVTVINSTDRKVLMTAEPDISANWIKLWNDLVAANLNLVSVNTLAGSAEAPKFFRDQLGLLITRPPQCNSQVRAASRAFIILSGAQFPNAGHPQVDQECDCSVFYLRKLNDYADSVDDDVNRILAPLHPNRLQFSSPVQFRQKLIDLLKGITATSSGT